MSGGRRVSVDMLDHMITHMPLKDVLKVVETYESDPHCPVAAPNAITVPPGPIEAAASARV